MCVCVFFLVGGKWGREEGGEKGKGDGEKIIILKKKICFSETMPHTDYFFYFLVEMKTHTHHSLNSIWVWVEREKEGEGEQGGD